MHYVYVLVSKRYRRWHYYGCTSDLKRRIDEHVAGTVRSTRHYRPLHLLYYEAYISSDLAKQRERQLKSSRSASAALLARMLV
ncbi:excinuclease ABC subunit C [Candidatus Saccharibacteria bacterium]|nr:MAG: excinuclease ABC subunit C [Candidatus Saccharibacteria bacterium]